MFQSCRRIITITGVSIWLLHSLNYTTFADTFEQEQGDKTFKQPKLKQSLIDVKVQDILKDREPQISLFHDELKKMGTSVYPKIVGGIETLKKEFPTVGAIIYNGKVHCTGTLIGPKTVLTAAHCVDGYDRQKLVFVTGNNALAPEKSYTIADGKVCDGYTKERLGANDLGLLYLNRTVDKTSPIASPNVFDDETLKTSPLDFVGYGYSDITNSGTLGVKRKVSMKIAKVSSTTLEYGVSDRNTCTGDSGGPAFIGNTVVGITSWGDSLCMEYGVNVRVDAYSPWIHKNIK